MSIRIGIAGYGNLGRGVECAVRQNEDMELIAVFTRRSPEDVSILTEKAGVFSFDEAAKMKDEIDILILCGGSAEDLPQHSTHFAKDFNIIDSFDTHARIPAHFAAVDSIASESGHIAVISMGWDPGMFSLNRVYAEAILPHGKTYTFWGKGISQGHSDAIRNIAGVADARQYTIPVESAIESVRNGDCPVLTTRQKHTRECFVVAEPGADVERIRREIINMPNYFSDYDTTVNFINQEELDAKHKNLPHGGVVIRHGTTGWEDGTTQIIEYSLKLESNPEFTSNILVAAARAAFRMNREGQTGCKTILDIPPAYFINMDKETLLREML